MPFVNSIRGTFGPQQKSRNAGDTASRFSVTGGTITTAGGYRIHTFTTVGTNTLNASGVGTLLPIEFLAIGGGGGGGQIGGGGGAGGYVSGTIQLKDQAWDVKVGAGGSGAGTYPGGARGTDGIRSSIDLSSPSTPGLYANGGGTGGGWDNGVAGNPGGSGGGGTSSGGGGFSTQPGFNFPIPNLGSSPTYTNIVGYPGYGSGDTVAGTGSGQHSGGGGGGAAGSGPGRRGGAGLANSITGTSVTYAGGGGGGSHVSGATTSVSTAWPGSATFPTPDGGRGGSIDYNVSSGTGEPGANGKGSGGGGGYYFGGATAAGGAGGSGIVVIRYLV